MELQEQSSVGGVVTDADATRDRTSEHTVSGAGSVCVVCKDSIESGEVAVWERGKGVMHQSCL